MFVSEVPETVRLPHRWCEINICSHSFPPGMSSPSRSLFFTLLPPTHPLDACPRDLFRTLDQMRLFFVFINALSRCTGYAVLFLHSHTPSLPLTFDLLHSPECAVLTSVSPTPGPGPHTRQTFIRAFEMKAFVMEPHLQQNESL